MKLTKTIEQIYNLNAVLQSIDTTKDFYDFKFKYANVKNVKVLQKEIDEFLKLFGEEQGEEFKTIINKPVEEQTEDDKAKIEAYNLALTQKSREISIEIDLMTYKTDWFPANFDISMLYVIEELIEM